MSWEMFATTKSNIQHICKTMKRWKSSLMLVKCGKEMPDQELECFGLEQECMFLVRLPRTFKLKPPQKQTTASENTKRLLTFAEKKKKDAESLLLRNTRSLCSIKNKVPPAGKSCVDTTACFIWTDDEDLLRNLIRVV